MICFYFAISCVCARCCCLIYYGTKYMANYTIRTYATVLMTNAYHVQYNDTPICIFKINIWKFAYYDWRRLCVCINIIFIINFTKCSIHTIFVDVINSTNIQLDLKYVPICLFVYARVFVCCVWFYLI